jgi:hypothetical protein
MAKSFLTDLNLNNNVLLNAKIQAWGSAPSGTTNPTGTGTAVTGQLSSYNGTLYIFNGTTWVQVGNPLSDSTSLTSSTTGASSTAVKSAYDLASAALPKAGGTMSGAIAMGNYKITGLLDPTGAQDAATKNYVDTTAQGLNIHDAVSLATAVAITTGLVYTAGSTGADGGTGVGATLAFTAAAIDGVTLTSTDVTNGTRILIKDQTTQTQNGIYVVTSVAATITLTRATDADNHVLRQLSAGDFVYVVNGTQNTGKSYVQATLGTAIGGGIKIGTDNIVYNQFGSAGTVPYATTSTAGIASFSNSQFNVVTGAVSVNNLSGALITSGLVGATYGGTGVNNGSNTITLGGNLTTSGAYSTTLTVTGATNVTLPTSGTLVNTTVTTLSSLASVGTITSGIWNGTAIAVANGGTGATSAATARANLGATTKLTGSITLVAGTQYTINHNLGTQAVVTQMFDSSWNNVEMDVLNFDSNNVKVTSSVAGTYNYVIIG